MTNLYRCCARLGCGAAAVAAFFAAAPAEAAEGGASFYLLGSGGPGAAILPPLPGLFFDNQFYVYDGKAGGNRQFVVGGNLVAGLEATIIADFGTVLWVPTTNFLGGTLAIGGAVPVGDVSIDVSAILTGPLGNSFNVSRSDDAFIIGDPIALAELGWNLGGNFHLAGSATVNIPIGHYREDQLANLSFHRWIVDTSVAATWHDPKSGWDVSAKAGFTFNGTNDYTDYASGNDFHLEAAVEKTISSKLSVGVLGYYYNQVSGDSGAGAVLGPNEGEVTGLGVTASTSFNIGKAPATLRFKLIDEFNVTRRLDGTSFWLVFDIPLSVKLPPGAGAE